MIPTEARIHLDNIADGLSPAQYIDAIWFRRDLAQGPTRSTGKWPIERTEPPSWDNFRENVIKYIFEGDR